MRGKSILFIEAFYGGSHKQLADLLSNSLSDSVELFTLPGKKWHWRARTSSLYFADIVPKVHCFRLLFTSSVLPLAEFLALRPDLAHLHKIVYFHENQLVYPVRKAQERDFQYGYNETLSCLVADKVIFNSTFNKESFFKSLTSYFNKMPDHKPKDLECRIRPKCSVLYFPLQFPSKLKSSGKIFQKSTSQVKQAALELDQRVNSVEYNIVSNDIPVDAAKKVDIQEPLLKKCLPCDELHIVWPHRWEHDKDPETFFAVLFRLKDAEIPFKLSVIGEVYSEKPEIFGKAEILLKEHIINWGYQESKSDYFSVLLSADVAVSTAAHEFFGVAMLEATSYGCYPLCPKRLSYPEIFPDEYLYNTANQLYKRLKYFCLHPYSVRNHRFQMDLSKFSWDNLCKDYIELLDSKHKDNKDNV